MAATLSGATLATRSASAVRHRQLTWTTPPQASYRQAPVLRARTTCKARTTRTSPSAVNTNTPHAVPVSAAVAAIVGQLVPVGDAVAEGAEEAAAVVNTQPIPDDIGLVFVGVCIVYIGYVFYNGGQERDRIQQLLADKGAKMILTLPSRTKFHC